MYLVTSVESFMPDADQFNAASALLPLQRSTQWRTDCKEDLDAVPIPPNSVDGNDTIHHIPLPYSGLNCSDSEVFDKMTNFPPATLESV